MVRVPLTLDWSNHGNITFHELHDDQDSVSSLDSNDEYSYLQVVEVDNDQDSTLSTEASHQ